jgi:hypothetical protein
MGGVHVITADQLVAHAIGDYILQSDWMAMNKRRALWVALVHAAAYSLPFLLFRPSLAALAVILLSHALIDRYGIARYVVWAKNLMGGTPPWRECTATGYPPDRPVWMTVWLMITADNCLHVLINGAALKWL